MTENVGDFIAITGVKFEVLFQICFIISLEVLGLVQFLKNFIKCKQENCKHIKENGHYCTKCLKWKWAFISFIVCFICSVANTTYVPPMVTRIFDFFMLSLAIIQMCHDILIKTLPKALSAIINKSLGVNVSSTQ